MNITLVESYEICIKVAKNAENLDTFLLNTVKNLKISECEEVNPFAEKLSRPVLKAIFKYSKHRSIIALNNVTNGWTFQFSCVSVADTFKEIKARVKLLKILKILKQNADNFTVKIFSFCVNESKFPNIFKQANVTPTFKVTHLKVTEVQEDLWIFYLSLLKYLKSFLVSKKPFFFYEDISNQQNGFRKGYIVQHWSILPTSKFLSFFIF